MNNPENKSKVPNEKELGRIWKILRKAAPEEKKRILANLNKETINALRVIGNPYKKPVFIGDKEKYLAFSVINLSEKYWQRFSMTTLIGFIYRMLDEYTIDNKDYISENDPKFANIYNVKVKEMLRSEPEKLLKQELENLKQKIAETNDTASLKELKKQMFFLKARIIKFKLYVYNEELKFVKDHHDLFDRECKSLTNEIKECENMIALLKSKLEKRIKYEEEQAHDSESYEEVSDEETAEETDKPTEPKTLYNTLTIVDVKRTIEHFNSDIENRSKTLENIKDKLSKNDSELQKTKSKMDELVQNINNFKESFQELKSAYNEATKKKYKKHPLENVEIDKYDPSENDLNIIAEQVKQELNISKTAEEHNDELQNIIQTFLDKYLVYNPDHHVRCAYKPNYADPLRTPLEELKHKAELEEKYELTLTPPDDTFFRWNRYIENNYEELRQATDDIYAEKSDLEFAIVPLEDFTGTDKDDAMEQFNKFKLKYTDEFDAEILCAKYGAWSLLGSWEENRNVRDFYTEKSEIIKRILDQNKEDVRMGQKLMGKRAETESAKNEAEHGKKDPKFSTYTSANPTQLSKHGAKHISEINSQNYIEESSIPKDTEEPNMEEVEINVHVIKPKVRGKGRRIRGFAENFKFNIPAEKPDSDQMKITTPGEHKKELVKQEMQ